MLIRFRVGEDVRLDGVWDANDCEMAEQPIPPFDEKKFEFKDWKDMFENYCRSEGKESPGIKLAALKYLGGTELRKLVEILPPRNDPGVGLSVSLIANDVYRLAMMKLEDYFERCEDIHLEREQFQSLSQHTDETAKKFMKRIREKAARCDCKDVEVRIQEQFVKGTKDDKVKRLARKRDTDADTLLAEATFNEASKSAATSAINYVRFEQRQQTQNRQGDTRACFFCKETGHQIKDCPRKSQVVCYTCNRRGHTSRYCTVNTIQGAPARRTSSLDYRSRPYNFAQRQPYRNSSKKLAPTQSAQKVGRNRELLNMIEISDEEALPDKDYICVVDGCKTIECTIGGIKQQMLIDTGTRRNVIPKVIWELMKMKGVKVFNQTKQIDVSFYAFAADKPLTVACSFEATTEAAGRKINSRFCVVDTN